MNKLYNVLRLLPLSVSLIFLSACLQDKGQVEMTSDPGDAKVFIDGERKGNTPSEPGLSFVIELAEGEHTAELVIDKGRFEQYGKKDIYVAKDTLQSITVKLDQQRASSSFKQKLKQKFPTVIEPEMVEIPAGSFRMGCVSAKDCKSNQTPVHTVRLGAFWMGKYEVTFDEWDSCVAQGGCQHYPDDEGWGRGKRPVMNVSYDDVGEYVQWINQQTAQHYRLPTEAEWEYATRAGTQTTYWWGNQAPSCNQNEKNGASFDGGKNSSCSDMSNGSSRGTAIVGSYSANPWGLYDVHGNVWEWVQDWYDGKYYANSPSDNPKGPDSGRDRVNRGGSWFLHARFMRSAYRNEFWPGSRQSHLGFRLVRQP